MAPMTARIHPQLSIETARYTLHKLGLPAGNHPLYQQHETYRPSGE
jgi:hypothetical protein